MRELQNDKHTATDWLNNIFANFKRSTRQVCHAGIMASWIARSFSANRSVRRAFDSWAPQVRRHRRKHGRGAQRADLFSAYVGNANQILKRNLETHVVRLDLDLVRSGQQRAELLSTPRLRTLKGPKRTPKQNWKKPASIDYPDGSDCTL